MFVLPGDVVTVQLHGPSAGPSTSSSSPSHPRLRLGPGLLRGVSSNTPSTSASEHERKPKLVVTRAGTLGAVGPSAGEKGKAKAVGAGANIKGKDVEGRWVEGDPHRYSPQPGDTVVCQITNRNPETYVVTLLTSYHSCTLPVLSFEGATKRSKPNLKVGALVYARVVQADRHSEPELSCVDLQTGKGEGLGELKVGEREEGLCTVFKISIPLAASMLMPSHPLLPALSITFPFEAAVGHNGIVWVRAAGPRQLIAFGKVLEAADRLDVYSIASKGRTRRQKPDQEDGDAEMADQKDDAFTAQDVVKIRGRLPEAEIKRIVQQYVA